MQKMEKMEEERLIKKRKTRSVGVHGPRKKQPGQETYTPGTAVLPVAVGVKVLGAEKKGTTKEDLVADDDELTPAVGIAERTVD